MQSFEQFPINGENALRPHQYPDYIKISTLVIVLSVVLAVFQGKDYIVAVNYLHQARVLQAHNDYDNAKALYIKALHYSPTSEDIKIGLAMACFMNKDSTDDTEGLGYLYGITFTETEYDDIKKVVPDKYLHYFTPDKERQ